MMFATYLLLAGLIGAPSFAPLAEALPSLQAELPRPTEFEAPAQDEVILLGKLQSWADDLQKRSGVPGLSIAIAWPDGKVVAAAAGAADLDSGEKMTVSHRLMSGSIGKTYFAALFLQLVESGKMSPDDLLSKYLGVETWYDRLPNAKTITLESLLRHSSGVSEHVQLPEFWAAAKGQPDRRWKASELIEFILDKDPLFEVDTGWSYADTNYILAGMAMEKVMDDSAYREVYRNILQPHGFAQTLPNTTPDLPGLCQGYHILGEPGWTEWKPVMDKGKFYLNPQLEWCGGGYYSTTSDLARWGAMLFGGKIVNQKSLDLALQSAVDARLYPGDRYGLGVIISQTPFGTGLGHSGWFPGYLSEMMYFPDLGCCIALQVNTDHIRKVGNNRGNLLEVAKLLQVKE